jgi:cytochrome c5
MKIYQRWVKKLVTKEDWNKKYKDGNYTLLSDQGSSKLVGFLIGQKEEELNMPLKSGVADCSDEDLRVIDLHRRSANIYPRPLEAK